MRRCKGSQIYFQYLLLFNVAQAFVNTNVGFGDGKWEELYTANFEH